MVDDLTSRQILELAAQGTPREEISSALAVEPALVNLVLSSHGQAAAERDIDDEQLAVLRRQAYKLALQNEDLGVSAKMTRFLIERDKPKAVAQTASPLANINQAIILAQGSSKKLMEEYFGTTSNSKTITSKEDQTIEGPLQEPSEVSNSSDH